MNTLAKNALLGIVLLATIACTSSPAWAHRPSESYVTFAAESDAGAMRLEAALRDLDWALTLDTDGDGSVTWSEVVFKHDEIVQHVGAGMSLASAAGPCAMTPGQFGLVKHSDGAHLSVPFAISCGENAGPLQFSYSLFFDQDPQHRALLQVEGRANETVILAKAHATTTLDLAPTTKRGVIAVIAGFVHHGASHIAEGFDHLLFLLLLLLPAVLSRENGQWQPLASLKPTLVEVTKVVTAFTVAHAITMSAAASGLVSVSPKIVEPAIALSLVVAAVNNIWPIFAGGRWALPFALGLLHGFGFSSALTDLGLPRNQLIPALFGFNLGVELGQLALVVIVVPIAFMLRKSARYRRFAITGGSLAIAAVAVFWFIERIVEGSFI